MLGQIHNFRSYLARDTGIDEVQRQADTVRQQLQNARNRIHVLAERLASNG
jgi:hypothetical protein